LTVSFDAAGSVDHDGSIADFQWSFGDGGTARGNTASHTYRIPGTYEPRLTVTDNDGAAASVTVSVVVAAGPTPGDLYIDANNGSDATGSGTQDSPYKTISKAISTAAGSPAVLHVAPGVYNAGLGEVFPLDLSNISLVGEGGTPDDVKLIGAVQTRFGGLVLRNVRCYYGIDVREATSVVSFENCKFTPATTSFGGISVYGDASCEVSFLSCRVEQTHVGVVGGAIAKIKDCEFSGGLCEVQLSSVGRVEFLSNSLAGYTLAIVGPTDASIVGNEFSADPGPGGWYMGISGPSAVAVIEDNSFVGVPREVSSVVITSTANVELRGNTFSSTVLRIEQNATALLERNVGRVFVKQSATVDLGGGALGSSGGNTVYVADNRILYSGPMYAVGNIWKDPQPSGEVPGPADGTPNYSITNEGNSIIFSE
jgi:PKD repeat protein